MQIRAKNPCISSTVVKSLLFWQMASDLAISYLAISSYIIIYWKPSAVSKSELFADSRRNLSAACLPEHLEPRKALLAFTSELSESAMLLQRSYESPACCSCWCCQYSRPALRSLGSTWQQQSPIWPASAALSILTRSGRTWWNTCVITYVCDIETLNRSDVCRWR